MTAMQLAVFDLDGTISRRDTLLPYVFRVCMQHPTRLLRVLRRMPGALLRYLLGGRDRGRLKEALIVAGLSGLARPELARHNEQFVRRLLARGVHEEAIRRIAEHRARGDYLVLMSASPDIYVPAVARALGFNETVCTGVRWRGMTLAGELVTPNRRGEEKLHCVRALRQRHPDRRIVAYGDSASDLVHLTECDRAYLVHGSDAANREAARRNVSIGWPLPSPPYRFINKT